MRDNDSTNNTWDVDSTRIKIHTALTRYNDAVGKKFGMKISANTTKAQPYKNTKSYVENPPV